MDIPQDVRKLTALFLKFGARDPESWAASQIEEGIPQLQRFLFLRQAWRNVIPDGNISWIGNAIQKADRQPAGPYTSVGAVLKRCRERGISDHDLTDLARGLQAEMLFGLCYLLDDPDFEEPELADFAWGLFEVDADGNPRDRIGSLHESVLETDPTGREMRPRS